MHRKILLTLLLFSSLISEAADSTDIGYIQEVIQKVQDPSRQTGNLNGDSLASLPIGLTRVIGNKKYIIAIDSAEFRPDGAYFSAYMGIRLPNAENDIFFAAKNIRFNPAGVVGGNQSKLQLVTRQVIRMGPNHELELPEDGSNFVEWDCNGFQSVQLHGKFHFDSDLIIPPDTTTAKKVTADFQVRIYDLQNIMTQISFTPFTINGMQDVQFEVSAAVLDMSDYSNPFDFQIPPAYQGTVTNTGNLWRGFYLKQLTVTLPEQFDKPSGPTTISANNVIIDDAGVTAKLEASNLISLDGGRMSGWPFSLDKVSVLIVMNELTGGSLEGQIEIPGLDDKRLDYEAMLMKNSTTQQLDYLFALGPPGTASFSGFGATMNIYETSQIVIESRNNAFYPRLVLNGDITIDHANFSLNQLQFQHLTLVPDEPYVTQGIFSLTSGGEEENDISKFPIQLEHIQLAFSQYHDPVLDIDASLNLGNESSNSISVESGIRMTAKVQQDPLGRQSWSLHNTRIKDIHLEVHTGPLNMEGYIAYFKNDPVFGRGFQGGLAIEIVDVLGPIGMQATFGKVDDYKYWKVDASLPVNISMGNVTLTQINGGVSDHMEGTKTPQDLIEDIANGYSLRQTYVPSDSAGLEFRAGVAFQYASEKTLNGDALFTVGFNSYGGLSHIQFLGEAYMMVKRHERRSADNWIRGLIAVNYDNNNKIFDAFLDVTANFNNKVTGNAWAKLYFSPNTWYVHIGKPSDPCTFSLLNFAAVNGYFMAGHDLEPMPPPPAYVTSALGNIPGQRDAGSIEGGNGFATGMNFDLGFGTEVDITNNISAYWYGLVGAGFDITLIKYPSSAYCMSGPGEFGMNGWYLTGQIYAYINIGVGVEGRALGQDFDLVIFDAEVAALLSGEGPNPTYARAQLYMSATILSVIEVSFNAEVEIGNRCNIVSS